MVTRRTINANRIDEIRTPEQLPHSACYAVLSDGWHG